MGLGQFRKRIAGVDDKPATGNKGSLDPWQGQRANCRVPTVKRADTQSESEIKRGLIGRVNKALDRRYAERDATRAQGFSAAARDLGNGSG